MTVEADRARLCSRDPLAMLVSSFVDSGKDSLEIVVPEPGTVLDGMRYVDTPAATPFRIHQRVYTMALRGHWLKDSVWVYLNQRSIWLYRTEELYRAAREARKKR